MSGYVHAYPPASLVVAHRNCEPVQQLACTPAASKGHEIVDASAETQLTDTARKRIKELLPQGTILADASTWPDKAGRQIPTWTRITSSTSPKTRTHMTRSVIASCAIA